MNGNAYGKSGTELLLSVFGAVAGLAILIVSGCGSAFGLFLLTACCARIAVGLVKAARKNKGKEDADV